MNCALRRMPRIAGLSIASRRSSAQLPKLAADAHRAGASRALAVGSGFETTEDGMPLFDSYRHPIELSSEIAECDFTISDKAPNTFNPRRRQSLPLAFAQIVLRRIFSVVDSRRA
jgi:hypothetical protein